MKIQPKKKKLPVPAKKVAAKPKAVAKKLPPVKKPVVAAKLPPQLPVKPAKRIPHDSVVSMVPKAKAPPPKPKAKAEPKKSRTPIDPALDYRKLRKYTVPMLSAILEELGAEATTKDLLKKLRKLEGQKKDWKAERNNDGVPRKRGRPSKADLEARAKAAKLAKLKPVADPAAVFAKAKAGGLVPARKAPPAPPPKAVAAAPKKVVLHFKKPAKAA